MFKIAFATALLGLAAAGSAQTEPGDAGNISFDTWASHARTRIMALDTNHDSRIDRAEFAARPARMSRHGEADAASADAKPDGGRMFERFDTNKDGALDATEIDAMLARRFARMDANHDRMLGADERHARHGMHAPEQ